METYSRILDSNPIIRCLDISSDRTKLAVVDENSTMTVYDLVTNGQIYQVGSQYDCGFTWVRSSPIRL